MWTLVCFPSQQEILKKKTPSFENIKCSFTNIPQQAHPLANSARFTLLFGGMGIGDFPMVCHIQGTECRSPKHLNPMSDQDSCDLTLQIFFFFFFKGWAVPTSYPGFYVGNCTWLEMNGRPHDLLFFLPPLALV